MGSAESKDRVSVPKLKTKDKPRCFKCHGRSERAVGNDDRTGNFVCCRVGLRKVSKLPLLIGERSCNTSVTLKLYVCLFIMPRVQPAIRLNAQLSMDTTNRIGVSMHFFEEITAYSIWRNETNKMKHQDNICLSSNFVPWSKSRKFDIPGCFASRNRERRGRQLNGFATQKYERTNDAANISSAWWAAVDMARLTWYGYRSGYACYSIRNISIYHREGQASAGSR